jgi:hypothetical protein
MGNKNTRETPVTRYPKAENDIDWPLFRLIRLAEIDTFRDRCAIISGKTERGRLWHDLLCYSLVFFLVLPLVRSH